MGKTKTDKITFQTRVEVVRQMLVRGAASSRLAVDIAKQFSVGERQAWNYIAAARDIISADNEKNREYLHAEHIAVRRHIRTKALDAGELRTALEAAKDEARLYDLYPVSKSEVSGPGGGAIVTRDDSITDDERVSRIAALLESARARRNGRAVGDESPNDSAA